MKILKGLLKFLINSTSVCLICTLIICTSGKDMFYDLLYANIFKPVMTESTKQVINNTEVDNSKIDELLNNKETKELVNTFIESTINDLSSDGKEVNTDIGNDFLEYVKENKDTIEKEFGVKLTDEQIDSIKETPEYQELTKSYQKSIQESKSKLSPKEKNALKTYNFIMSKKFKYILMGLIALCTILVALIEFSIYKWIKDFAINLLTSGGMLLGISLALETIINSVTSKIENANITFTSKALTTASITIIIAGVIFLITYLIISKLIVKKPPKEKEKKKEEQPEEQPEEKVEEENKEEKESQS